MLETVGVSAFTQSLEELYLLVYFAVVDVLQARWLDQGACWAASVFGALYAVVLDAATDLLHSCMDSHARSLTLCCAPHTTDAAAAGQGCHTWNC